MEALKGPWERLPTESGKAFAAFCAYRDMLPSKRSHRGLANTLGKSSALVSRWSGRHQWLDRVAAWDAELDRQRRLKQIKAIQEMGERQATIALMYQQKILERLKDVEPAQLGVRDLATWLEVATKVEREARGMPHRLELSGEVKVKKSLAELSDDDLQRIIEGSSDGTVGPETG